FSDSSRAMVPASRAASSSSSSSDAADCKVIHDQAGDFEGAAVVDVGAAAQAFEDVEEIARDGDFANRVRDLAVLEPITGNADRAICRVRVERRREHVGDEDASAGVFHHGGEVFRAGLYEDVRSANSGRAAMAGGGVAVGLKV